MKQLGWRVSRPRPFWDKTSFDMIKLTEIDTSILKLAQGDLPAGEQPFSEWAARLGISEEELLDHLKSLKESGVIRDFKAILRHQRAGINANAIVVWAVEEAKVEEAGKILSSFEAVTHCYERPYFGKYNIFTMIHAKTRKKLLETIKKISDKTGIADYQAYWSKREFKKTSRQYF